MSNLRNTQKASTPSGSQIGALLWQSGRLVVDVLTVRLANLGFADLNSTLIGMVPLLREKDVRATTLAERLGISKQAVGKLLADLEAKGYIVRIVDPLDKRSNQVQFTKKGNELLAAGDNVKRQLEKDCLESLSATEKVVIEPILKKLENSLHLQFVGANNSR